MKRNKQNVYKTYPIPTGAIACLPTTQRTLRHSQVPGRGGGTLEEEAALLCYSRLAGSRSYWHPFHLISTLSKSPQMQRNHFAGGVWLG